MNTPSVGGGESNTKIDLSRFRQTFLEEAGEHLASLEAGLLRLESERGDPELLNQIFRAAHSIKGSAGMFGFSDVSRFTHGLETLLDRVREGRVQVSAPLVDLLLRGSDHLAQLVAAARTDAPANPDAWTVLAELSNTSGAPESGVADGGASTAESSTRLMAFRVRMTPGPDMLRAGSDPLLLLRDLAALGDITRVTADVSRLPTLAALDPECCWLAWTIEIETSATLEAMHEVFTFVEDLCTVEIEGIGQSEQPRTDAPPAAVIAAAAPPAGDSPGKDERRSGYDRRTGQHVDSTSIRVSVEKVDELINLVGELVISQSMVSQIIATHASSVPAALGEAVATLERNVRDIQERVMSVRMLPVGNLFARFPRLVRDVSASIGKQVVLELHGEETELDKSVIERLSDPLTHLVRNAMDHGIEAPDARRAAGKPEQATVRLAAFHEGGSVIIEITDDGAGLDHQRIRAKAVAQGLIAPDDVLTDEQTHHLILLPGFSTAEQVSDLSGRGVGLDVVRRNVESLNGTVSIASRAGQGTTFRIKLPLTLAILEGMQLRVGTQVYVLPLLAIIESFRPTRSEVKTVLGGGEITMVRGEPLPLHRLHALLGIDDAETDPTRGLVVVLEHEGKRLGVLVDELLGQAQVVIKSLEANFRRVDGITGATIMGDGHVALILDIDGVARLAAVTPSFTRDHRDHRDQRNNRDHLQLATASAPCGGDDS